MKRVWQRSIRRRKTIYAGIPSLLLVFYWLPLRLQCYPRVSILHGCIILGWIIVFKKRRIYVWKQIPRVWGPSYSLWYKFLSFFISDRIELYYLISSLPPSSFLFFFLLLMSCGVQRILAFVFSLFFLSTFINLPLWPRVSHFCIIVLITGILIAKYHKNNCI